MTDRSTALGGGALPATTGPPDTGRLQGAGHARGLLVRAEGVDEAVLAEIASALPAGAGGRIEAMGVTARHHPHHRQFGALR